MNVWIAGCICDRIELMTGSNADFNWSIVFLNSIPDFPVLENPIASVPRPIPSGANNPGSNPRDVVSGTIPDANAIAAPPICPNAPTATDPAAAIAVPNAAHDAAVPNNGNTADTAPPAA